MNLNLNLNDTEINMLPKHSQKPLSIYEFSSKHVSVWCRKNIFGNNAVPFLDAEEMHSWSNLKANVCMFLYISVKKLF